MTSENLDLCPVQQVLVSFITDREILPSALSAHLTTLSRSGEVQ